MRAMFDWSSDGRGTHAECCACGSVLLLDEGARTCPECGSDDLIAFARGVSGREAMDSDACIFAVVSRKRGEGAQ